MDYFDVFNGDADGLCALLQLRLAFPREATLVTGVKRDISLLERVPLVRGASVTVLDISLERNRDALLALLNGGARVAYFDHHFAGQIPQHAGLVAHIDGAVDVCTSMLVDRHVGGVQRSWAIAGAFGDNLDEAAQRMAASLALRDAQIEALQDLGQCLNYNAYGEREQDLFVAPAALYQLLLSHRDPFLFIEREPVLDTIRRGRRADLALAMALEPSVACDGGQVFLLPDAPWSRRVRGDFANTLSRRAAGNAYALLTPDGHGDYVVSVRAAPGRPQGADALCRQFPGGGGRVAAAGIDRLAPHRLADFVRAFSQSYCQGHVH